MFAAEQQAFQRGHTKYGYFQYSVGWSSVSRFCAKCGRVLGRNGESYVYIHSCCGRGESHLCHHCHHRYYVRLCKWFPIGETPLYLRDRK